MTQIIGGLFKGRRLFTPKTRNTRVITAALKKSLFDIVAPYIEHAQVLDLFAGSGSIGFEALSRGADHVTFIDLAKEAIKALKKNVSLLQVEDQCTVYQQDALKFLASSLPNTFDLIFIDPPYSIQTKGYQEILSLLDKNPSYLSKKGVMILEMPVQIADDITKTPLQRFEKIKEKRSGTTTCFFYKALLRCRQSHKRCD